MKHIYVYGTGRIAKRYVNVLDKQGYDIAGYSDTYCMGSFHGKPTTGIGVWRDLVGMECM